MSFLDELNSWLVDMKTILFILAVIALNIWINIWLSKWDIRL